MVSSVTWEHEWVYSVYIMGFKSVVSEQRHSESDAKNCLTKEQSL